MVGALSLNDVGVVGNKHVSPQGGVVHAGVVATPDIFNVTYESRPGFDARYELASRDVLAVTGACTAIRRDLWTALGGMNESLEVECNDIDLCLRVLEMGKYILYLSNVEIIHAEKASRGPSLALADNIRFFEMWDLYSGDADPFFSPNYDFAMGRVSCRITVAPSDVTGFFRHEPTEVLGHKE
jgi:GT2 family glycosyltransferase